MRRKGPPDRRTRPTPAFARVSISGRRRFARRKGDHDRHLYVDRYDPYSVMVILTGLFLCLADAVFTLLLLNRGASEVNPIMNFFLGFGPLPFLLTKYALTGGSLLFLLVHKNRTLLGGRLYVRHILAAVPLLYSLLILWELTLKAKLG